MKRLKPLAGPMAAFLTAFLTALLLAVLAGCEFGSAPGGGTGAEGLTGILVNGRGEPVTGARVRVGPATAASTALAKSSAALAARADSTFTDADGRYRFKRLPSGTYNLEASLRAEDTAYGLFVSGIVFSKSLDLGVDTLKATGSLRLRVRTASSAAVSGARCAVVGGSAVTLSDGDGVCRFAELGPGVYRVSIMLGSLGGTTDTLTVSSGEERDGGVASLVEGNGAPANWLRVSALDYTFDLPPELEIVSEGSGIDSWDAVYQAPGSRLYIGQGMTGPLQRMTRYPEYREETISLGGGETALLMQYRLPDSVVNWDPTVYRRYVAGLQTGWSDPEFKQYFYAGGDTPADRDRLVRMLRSVRKWTGAGAPPVSPSVRPSIVTPAHGMADVTRRPTLFWQASNNADTYRVQVALDSNFTRPVVDSVVPGVAPLRSLMTPMSLGLTLGRTLEANTAHYWRVNAANVHGGSAYSAHGRFVTGNSSEGWSARPAGTRENLNGVTWAGTRFVAVGDRGAVSTSTDGLSWSVQPAFTPGSLNDVAWTGSQFVIVGWAGIFSSPDGAAWTARACGGSEIFHSVLWNGALAVAVGSSGRVCTSPDGITWTNRSFEALLIEPTIAWNGSSFLMGGGSKLFASPDGLAWTAKPVSAHDFESVTWSGTEWVGVGHAQAFASSDGQTWSSVVIPGYPALKKVARGGPGLLAVGARGMLASASSGLAGWKIVYSGTARDLRGVAWNGTRAVAVGDSGTVVVSP